MPLDEAKIIEILLAEDYVDQESVDHVPEDESVIEALVQEGILSKQIIGQAVAEHFSVTYTDLTRQRIDNDVFFVIPGTVARAHNTVAVASLKKGIKIVTAEPDNIDVLNAIQKRFNKPLIVTYASEQELAPVLSRYQPPLQEYINTILEENGASSRDEREAVASDIGDAIINYAIRAAASDIHCEPEREQIVVRFRIDGVLHDMLTLEKPVYLTMLSHIKVMARMRIDEHRAAQDGKLRFHTDDTHFTDIRISIVPTKYGENVVMRLLSAEGRQYTLGTLGFSGNDLERINEAVDSPHGMILVTGPTGSGKSTTLYGVLKKLNKRNVHIATIEDPVEYDIEGVTQIQVNEQTNLSFANGLRALVRQDPDIIMVGEIRDQETAGIAVNSALTGHLVLSTLHTNDAPTALPRLLDMHVEPFLVASTIEVIIAQRLVRKICPSCIGSYVPSAAEKKKLFRAATVKDVLKKKGYTEKKKITLYKGSGCKICNDTGYIGRMGLFEVLAMTETLRTLVMKEASADDIRDQAVKEGMTTMLEDGIAKALEGQTTIEEVLRVAAN